MRKIISFMVIFVMILSTSLSAFAEDGYNSYDISEKSRAISGCTKYIEKNSFRVQKKRKTTVGKSTKNHEAGS